MKTLTMDALREAVNKSNGRGVWVKILVSFPGSPSRLNITFRRITKVDDPMDGLAMVSYTKSIVWVEDYNQFLTADTFFRRTYNIHIPKEISGNLSYRMSTDTQFYLIESSKDLQNERLLWSLKGL